MILDKFIRFINLIYKALRYKCRRVFKITRLMRRVTFFLALAINFALFRKHLTRFTTPLTAQDASKLTENERNAGRCATKSSEKGVNR